MVYGYSISETQFTPSRASYIGRNGGGSSLILEMNCFMTPFCLILSQLAQCLTQDFLKEGFLCKTGPKPSDGFKRRWFTLDGRKLMYHDQKLVRKRHYQIE
jgi:hypothetical protein